MTVVLIVLERTRAGPLGLVLAVIVTSAGVAILRWGDIATVRELSAVPRALPLPAQTRQHGSNRTSTAYRPMRGSQEERNGVRSKGR